MAHRMNRQQGGTYVAKRRNNTGRKGAKTTMPLCQYGAACTRRDCVYRHPPKAAKSDQICMHYIAGQCTYGARCANQHPGRDVVERLRAKYATQPCRWGSECRTQGCIYYHAPSLEATAKPFVPAGFLPASAQPFVPAGPPVPASIKAAAAAPTPPAVEGEGLRELQTMERSVRIPGEVWTPQVARNSAHYHILDPLERYAAVNASSKPGVVDLHFQSTATVVSVLQSGVLDAALANDAIPSGEGDDHVVWVVTGTRHHAERGQRATGLFECVETYLREGGYRYVVGKDGGSGVAGAFRVSRLT